MALLAPPLACRAQGSVQDAVSITPNFKDADITRIIDMVQRVTGKSFIVDPRVRAQVTMYSSAPMTPPAFYQAFLSILAVYGFIAVPAGNNVVKIVPDADARQMPSSDLPATVSSSSDEIVTQVIPVKNVSAAELVPILRPMIPQYGDLAAYPPSNILIISDRASNVHRMMAIIERIDRVGNQDVDVMPLQNASASEVVRTIDSLYEGQGNLEEGRTLKVVADDRTNSVLISGDPAQRLRIRALVAELDTPLQSGGNTRVVYLHYADASKLAPLLKQQMQELAQLGAGETTGAKGTPQAEAEKNALVWADKQNNALVITAPPKVMRTILDIVDKLDIRVPQVLVQAIIAEVQVTKTDDLGVNWAAYSQSNKVPLGGFVEPVGNTSIVDLVAAGASGVTGLSDSILEGTTLGIGTISASGESFAAMLRAVKENSTTNVVATPSAVTLDNQSATLKDVEEVPFVSGSYTTPTTTTTGAVTPFQTYQQVEVGTILKVTPTISPDGSALMLKLSVESSSVLPTSTSAVNPTTEKRSVQTNVLIENGGIVVLGGLISNTQNRADNGIPFLESIPLLGNLFKARNDSANRDDLMIFIKPTILSDQFQSARQTGRIYDYMMHQEKSVVPEPWPRLLRGEPAPVMPPPPPPPPPGTLRTPVPNNVPSGPGQKPKAKAPPQSGQNSPAGKPAQPGAAGQSAARAAPQNGGSP
ncbi:MAG: type II secretion system secretin GspD [Steroidobacteraceae bacterium]